MPYLVEQGFSRGDLGFALSGISIAYGFFEIHHGFGIGSLESARFSLPAGLILAAAVMLFMGFVPWATSSIAVMFVLLFLCGWFQGWGGRRVVVLWCTGGRRKNVAALCQCGTVRTTSVVVFRRCCSCWGWLWFNDWHAALYMPAFCAILVALFAFAMMRDTPQSCGLPPIEEYKK